MVIYAAPSQAKTLAAMPVVRALALFLFWKFLSPLTPSWAIGYSCLGLSSPGRLSFSNNCPSYIPSASTSIILSSHSQWPREMGISAASLGGGREREKGRPERVYPRLVKAQPAAPKGTDSVASTLISCLKTNSAYEEQGGTG